MLRAQGEVARPSVVFKWGVCRSLTEVALDDLDPDELPVNAKTVRYKRRIDVRAVLTVLTRERALRPTIG